MALDRIYTDELDALRNLGREFADENPALAPFLSSSGGDPDIERLLQGFAFLSSMVRQKLDDEIPEFIHDVAALIAPELTKPLPALTVLQLQIDGKAEAGYSVPAYTQYASMPVEGTECLFSTSWELKAQPVVLDSAIIEVEPNLTRLKLDCHLQTITLGRWTGNSISLFLSGAYVEASSWLMAMRKKLIRVRVLSPDDTGASVPLTLGFPGLDPAKHLFEVDRSVAPHLRWIREFLAFPERAFFIELSGFKSWQRRPVGNQFTIEFDFAIDARLLPKPGTAQFALNSVPAANTFDTFAEPISVNYLKESFQLIPAGYPLRHAEVHDVRSVVGRRQGEPVDRHYVPFFDFLTESDVGKYQITFSEGLRNGSLTHSLRLHFSSVPRLDQSETLSVRMTCTNGRLPERLRLKEINKRTIGSPERISVSNITTPTVSARPSLNEDAMWKIVGHARLNLQAIGDVKILKEMLSLYAPDGGDPFRLAAIRRRIEGITALDLIPMTRLYRGTLLRGQMIDLKLNGDYFSGPGDAMLLGDMLVQLFAGLIPINSFVHLRVSDSISGEQFEWPTLLAPGLTL